MSVISQFIKTISHWVEFARASHANLDVSHEKIHSKKLRKTVSRHALKAVLTGLIMLPLSALAAVDWLVQVSDTGFDPVAAGANIVYDVRVANNGNSPAPSTTVDLAISANSTYLSAAGLSCSPAGPVVGPTTITCTVPTLTAAGNAGDNALVQITVRTSISGVVSLGASIPTAGDSDTANNAPPAENTTVNAGADVSLSVTGPATAQSGSTVTYVYTLTNNGPDATTGSVLTIPKPTGLDNITTPSGCSLAGSTYTCNLAAIGLGADRTINFVGQLSVSSGSTVTPQGSVVASGATLDPVATNNTDTTSTTVTAGSDLIIAKSSAPSGGSQLVGSAVTFTLAPRYTGDVPGAMTITDTIPSNYTIGAVASPQNGWTCSVTGQVVTCTKPSGTVAGLNVLLGNIVIPTTASSAGASVVNTASINGPGGQDPNLANNSASSPAMTLDDPTVDLRANKAGPNNPALVVVGSTYDFDISITNIGTSVFFGTARMVDNLPSGLTVNSYTLNGWACLPAAPVIGPAAITCERVYTAGSPLGLNTTTPIVRLNTTVTTTGNIVNSLTVSSPDANIADLNATNDTVTYAVDGADNSASADINLVKTISNPGVAPYTIVVGDELEYKLEIVNSGPVTSNNVTLSDALQTLINSNEGPTGAGFIDATIVPGTATGGSCSSVANGGDGRNLTCTFTTIPMCSNGVDCPIVYVRVRPGGNATVTRTNTANAISSVTHDPNLGNNTDTSDVSTVTAKADVTVTKTASVASVPAGQNLTYVITASNIANGLSSADNVSITDTLPSNLVFISATPSTGSCATQPTANSTTGAGNNQLQCNLGNVVNGGQQTVTVVVRPRTEANGTPIVNNVDVTTTTPEDITTNNHADISVNVTAPVFDLLINKTVSIDPIAAGDDTVYTVTVQNQGPSATQGIVITDNLPATRLSYQSSTVPTDGTCPTVPAVNAVGGTVVCNLPYLAAGATASFTVTMRGVVKGVDNNTAHITSSADIAFDTVAGNNTRTIPTTVRTKADMEVVSKIPSATPVNINQPFNYIIKVTNNGPSEADEVVVSDNLPAGMQLTGAPVAVVVSGTTVPAVPVACTGVAGGTALSCDLGTVNLGAIVDITVPVRVVSSGGVFNNTASVLTSSLDTNGGSNPLAGNNFKTTPVTVNKSSLAGVVYRDVNDDGAQLGAGETGIVGVQVRLTGTDFYGNAITRNATTAADGTYLFDNLPQSDATGYTVIEVAQPATFSDGKETVGSQSGTPGADHTTDIISAIVLPANTAATGYLFGEIPPVIVSGTVFNDTNGLNDTFVNGTGTNTGSGTLTAYLVQGGLIVSSGIVAANGTFSLAAAANTNGYTVVLSNTAGVAIGAVAPAASLPAGWVNTGENNDLPTSAGSDGTINGISAPFNVALVTVPNRNFGIERPPTAGVATYPVQTNPGGTGTLPVGAGAFTGALPVGVVGSNATDPTAVTNIRITALPTNVTSITINGTTYSAGTFPPGGVTVTVAELAGMNVDPVDGLNTIDISYVAIDAAGQESNLGHVILPFTGVTVSGHVYDDANGLLGTPANTVDGTGTNAGSGSLSAYLVNSAGNVVASSPVLAAGTFSFGGVTTANGYTVVLSNTAGSPNGVPPPAVSLPVDWVNTGENNAANTVAGSDGTVNGISALFDVIGVDVIDRNFGVDHRPITTDVTGVVQPNPGGAIRVQVPTLVGSDTEDGPKGAGNTFIISTLPNPATMGLLYYNGVLVTAGQTIVNYDPTLLTVDPVDGALSAVFTVASVDFAGVADLTPNTVTIPFSQLIISGNVFNDADGSKVKNGAENSAIPAGLNAVLTDAAGVVIALVPVDASGNYSLPASPNTTYSVVITLANPAISANTVPVNLPAGWVTTGENLAGVVESTPDSRQTVTTGVVDRVNVNFGIAQPTAAVSGNVWRDADHNRAFGAGEIAVQGITVELLNAAGNAVIKSTVTDASGHYAITSLAPGDYIVRFRDGATGGIILGSPTFDDQLANTLPGAGTGATPNGSSVLDTIGQTLKVSLIANQELQRQSLPFDPSGVVYNSITREPVQGATVTLLSGGVAIPPSCLIGNQNAQVTGPLGTYQYLLIKPAPSTCPGTGLYTIQVVQPSGFLPPNAQQGGVTAPAGTYTPANGVSVDAIQVQSVPPTGAQSTLYFFNFNFDLVNGNGVVNNHIPLDPVLSNSFIVSKTGNKTIAEIGDVVTYTVKARMTQGLALSTFDLVDNLPAGFRYIPGTATQSTGGAAMTPLADSLPAGNLGPQLTFKPSFATQVTEATVTYKVRVGVGAMQGDGINRVQGRSAFTTSNTAQFKVKVTGGVFTNDACVAGKVFVDCNNNHIQDAEELGIPGVRMYMEDGTYFISDVEGKYSYCGISPKTHVLKVDSLTMPRGSRMTTTSNRNAGDANSLFLDTKNGELIRADFAEGSCSNTILEQVKARRTGGEVRAPETEKKGGPAIKFEGKSPAYPQQGTDSANQRLVKPRGGAGDASVSNTVNDHPVQPLTESSGNTRGNNLRDQKGEAK